MCIWRIAKAMGTVFAYNQSSSEYGYFLHEYQLTLQPILMKLQH